jgi:hypothetical protein
MRTPVQRRQSWRIPASINPDYLCINSVHFQHIAARPLVNDICTMSKLMNDCLCISGRSAFAHLHVIRTRVFDQPL